MTTSPYTDEAGDWEFEPKPFVPVPWWTVPPPIVIDFHHVNAARRQLRAFDSFICRLVRPSAEALEPTVGAVRILETRGRRWVHETLFVHLVVDGRSTAELASASHYRFMSWWSPGIFPERDNASNQAWDMAWELDELADREIVWHMTQELPPEAGWRGRWNALGETTSRQEDVVRAHPELVVELLALPK